MSGNKIRKLEFLLADCIRKGIKSVVTVGGVQSNHWNEFTLSKYHVTCSHCRKIDLTR